MASYFTSGRQVYFYKSTFSNRFINIEGIFIWTIIKRHSFISQSLFNNVNRDLNIES